MRLLYCYLSSISFLIQIGCLAKGKTPLFEQADERHTHVRRERSQVAGRQRLTKDASLEAFRSTGHIDRLRGLAACLPHAPGAAGHVPAVDFRGGFELAAAQHMLGNSDSRNFAAVKVTLRGLRDTSCLQLSALSAAGSCAARYSMHPLVAEIFREDFGALSEPHRRFVLQDFIWVMGGTTHTLEMLRGFGPSSPHAADVLDNLDITGPWPDEVRLLAAEALNFQELRSIVRRDRAVSASLDRHLLVPLIRVGGAMQGLGQHAQAAALLRDTTELAGRIP